MYPFGQKFGRRLGDPARLGVNWSSDFPLYPLPFGQQFGRRLGDPARFGVNWSSDFPLYPLPFGQKFGRRLGVLARLWVNWSSGFPLHPLPFGQKFSTTSNRKLNLEQTSSSFQRTKFEVQVVLGYRSKREVGET